MKKEGALRKVVALFIFASVMLLLFFLGPASAYTISLLSSSGNVLIGDMVDFVASLKINSNEILDIGYLVLKLNINGSDIECKFYPNATIISGCDQMKIQQVSSLTYGYHSYGYNYGYGYTNGELKYNITLDTTNYSIGTYKTSLEFVAGNNTFSSFGNNLKISSPTGWKIIKNSCDLKEGESILDRNIRGKLGILIVNGTVYNNVTNKLMLSVPSKGATRGQGYITSQNKRERFEFKFKVISVKETEDKAYVNVNGTYRIGLKKRVPLVTVLVLDKKTGTTSMNSDTITLSDMNVIFNGRGCS